MLPAVVKPWAPRGAARRGNLPLLRVPLTRDQLSGIRALTTHGQLVSRTYEGTINGNRVVACLRHSVHPVPGTRRGVGAGAAIQRWHAVKQVRAAGGAKRLKRLALPRSTPDLKPAAGGWQWRKRAARGNGCCATLQELRSEVRLAIARLRQRKDVLAACLRRPSYIQ